MGKIKKFVQAVRFSQATCKKNNVTVYFEILVSAIVLLLIPLIQNYFAKYIVTSITNRLEITLFIRSLVIWITSIWSLKVISRIVEYRYLKKNRLLRTGVMREINHLRMCVPFEFTLDSNYQKKLSLARTVMDRSVPCVAGIQNELITLFTNIISIIIYMTIITKLHWSILLVSLCVYCMELLINLHYIKLSRAFRDILLPLQRKIAYLAGRSGDFRSAKDVRVYNMSRWFSEKYDIFNNEKKQIINQREAKSHQNRLVNCFLMLFRNIVSYIILLLMFYIKEIDISEFVFYTSVMTTFTVVLSKLRDNIQMIYTNYLEVTDYNTFVNSSRYMPSSTYKNIELPKEIQTIEFNQVSYRYPGTEHDILKNINLLLSKNEKTGIVGLNGAGKTTLVLLMCGLLKPTEGRILINGNDISNYKLSEYANRVSALFQEINVLPDNVLNNIGLQKVYSEEEIKRIKNIMHECGLDHVRLEDTFINEIFDDAICLSGGEMQKLALARAIYKTSQVLILDEPTASLDPLSEQLLYQNYGKFSDNKISVFISHRLASTAFCDRIVMLEDGKIIESGNHLHLMNQNGKYRDLFETQREYYKKKLMEDNCW